MIIRQIQCKSVLTRSGISAVDYAINPYVGCEHACAYCYAVFMKRFTGHKEEWGQFVDIRVNASQVLARQLRRARPGSITLGTVTDAYQPLEREYQLARGCLEALLPFDQFPITVLTKSPLVLRDLDLLREMGHAEVALTVTTLDEAVRRAFEPHAAPTQERLTALARIHDTGIRTWAFFGPVLPAFSDSDDAMDKMFAALGETAVSYVLVDTLNVKGAQRGRLYSMLESHYPEQLDRYRLIQHDRRGYAQGLAARVARAAERHNVSYRLAF